ncbi:hypothetical protein OXB_2875 [Bacillus sp. OxB-1]|uniref:V-type ATPase subunit n=1 Tax=Bacillus sp. (strain OxB-1) TaxID=98228 RepID=UPI000582266A|nr:V-type ATPase subunit [Bacillus sp. OxB-1]BAQ11346.1 hypothetical protein OXB_2875 [Bacillus sp. OxB-1]
MSELSMQYQQNQQGNVLGQATASREMEEVKGAIFLAKQFPRNVYQSEQRIMDACKRPSLAETAIYQYPRGGTKVAGPSIRLAEVVAQNWGNIDFGIKELEQREGESTVMAYAWDLETNTRQTKVFSVKHSRQAGGQLKKLTDPRDIYEMVANQGARRVRSCILGIIPGDIIEKATEQCQKTLAGASPEPLRDRVAKMLNYFKETYSVTQEMIEDRFGYNADSFTEIDLVNAKSIINSLKDGMASVDDYFDKNVQKKQSSGLADSFKEEEKPKEAKAAPEEPKADPVEEGGKVDDKDPIPSDAGELPLY